MTIAGRIYLKAGRDGPVRGGNPWIFSQAIGRIEPAALRAGDWVAALDAGGDALGLGYYNPATTIAVRMLSFDVSGRMDVTDRGHRRLAGSHSEQQNAGSVGALEAGDIIRHRIGRALALRQRIVRGDTDCYRLINGDGDGLSGVVVDRYGGVLVVQLLTAGADRMRDEIVAALNEIVAPRSIVERSHGAVRKQEGLADQAGLLAGEPPTEALAVEHGIRLAIDFDRGQKTGAFLDQRDNRAMVRDWRMGRACSTPTATRAASRWRRWRVAHARWSRSIRRSGRWRWSAAISNSTAIGSMASGASGSNWFTAR